MVYFGEKMAEKFDDSALVTIADVAPDTTAGTTAFAVSETVPRFPENR